MTVVGMTIEAEEAASAGSYETLWQLLGLANREIPVVEFGVSFDSTSPTAEPVQVELVTQSTAGTATGATEFWVNSDSITPQVVAQHSFTVEPTLTTIIAMWNIHPAGGNLIMQYPLGREPKMVGATRIGLRIKATAAVNAASYVWWEE